MADRKFRYYGNCHYYGVISNTQPLFTLIFYFVGECWLCFCLGGASGFVTGK